TDLVASQDLDMPAELPFRERGNLRFLLGQELGIPSDDRDLGSHRGEEMPELGGNVAPADDRDALRPLPQFHPDDRVAGVIPDLIEPLDRRDNGPGSASDKGHLSSDGLAFNLQGGM